LQCKKQPRPVLAGAFCHPQAQTLRHIPRASRLEESGKASFTSLSPLAPPKTRSPPPSCDHRHDGYRINHPSQFRETEEFFPDLTIIGGDGQEIGYAPGFGFGIGIIPCHPALKMGIATGVVRSWESGSSQPDSHQLEVLVKFLGATLNLLLPTNNGW
jgi:hypothetical protein